MKMVHSIFRKIVIIALMVSVFMSVKDCFAARVIEAGGDTLLFPKK